MRGGLCVGDECVASRAAVVAAGAAEGPRGILPRQ